jgi:hypothetical protein
MPRLAERRSRLRRAQMHLTQRWRGKLLNSVVTGTIRPPYGDRIELETEQIRQRASLWSLPNRLLGTYRVPPARVELAISCSRAWCLPTKRF